MSVNHPYNVCPAHQADATLSQAAAVQDTWYTILDTTQFVRLYLIAVQINTTGETLEVRITIDGQTLTSPGVACGADTPFRVRFTTLGSTLYLDSVITQTQSFFLEGRSVKVEVRKTTAAGAGTLIGRIVYAKW